MSSTFQKLQRRRASELRSLKDTILIWGRKGEDDCDDDCPPTPPSPPPTHPAPDSTTSQSTTTVAQTTTSSSFTPTSTISSISSTIGTTTATTSGISSSTSTSTTFATSPRPSSSQSTFSSSIDQSSLLSTSPISTTAQPDTASSSSSVATISFTSSPLATASGITSVQVGSKFKISDPIAIVLVVTGIMVGLVAAFFFGVRYQRRKDPGIHESPSGSPPVSPSQRSLGKGVAESHVVPVTADSISTVTMSSPFTSNPFIPKGDTKQGAIKKTRFSIPEDPFVDPDHDENIDIGSGFTKTVIQHSPPKSAEQSPRVIRTDLYVIPEAAKAVVKTETNADVKTNAKAEAADDEKGSGSADKMVFDMVRKEKDGGIVEVGKKEIV